MQKRPIGTDFKRVVRQLREFLIPSVHREDSKSAPPRIRDSLLQVLDIPDRVDDEHGVPGVNLSQQIDGERQLSGAVGSDIPTDKSRDEILSPHTLGLFAQVGSEVPWFVPRSSKDQERACL